MSHKKRNIKKATAKLLLAGVLSFGAITITAPVMAQTAAPQAPPPPPAPGDVLSKAGEGLKKINPFKKRSKSVDNKLDTKVEAPQPGDTPPTPPNPLDLFKKKKKGGSILPPPPKPPGS